MRRRAIRAGLIGAALAIAAGVTWARPRAGQTGRIRLTTYCDRCSPGNVTASGRKPRVGRTIAAGRQWPFGTVVWIEGLGRRVVDDRGGAVHSHFDVYVARCPGKSRNQHTNCWRGPGLGSRPRAYRVISVPKR